MYCGHGWIVLTHILLWLIVADFHKTNMSPCPHFHLSFECRWHSDFFFQWILLAHKLCMTQSHASPTVLCKCLKLRGPKAIPFPSFLLYLTCVLYIWICSSQAIPKGIIFYLYSYDCFVSATIEKVLHCKWCKLPFYTEWMLCMTYNRVLWF